jgi:hypothetical protein
MLIAILTLNFLHNDQFTLKSNNFNAPDLSPYNFKVD